MTEIPEHLLKRSKERRAAMGLPGGEGGGDGGGAASTSDATPAKTEAPAPAPAKVEAAPPPPPKPKPAFIRAAEGRRRIPFWAMSVVVLLPLWAFMYRDSVTVPEQGDTTLQLGAEVYGSCAGCHGADGSGGTGAQLNEGEVLLTFPDPVAMMEWIHVGSNEWVGGTSGPYGDPDRPGGPHDAGTLNSEMPGSPSMGAEELAAVTRYIREALSGEVITPEVAEMYQEWAELAIENSEAGELIYRDTEADQERIDLVSTG